MILKNVIGESPRRFSNTIKKLTIKEFAKKNWLLFVILPALLIISIIIFLIFFWNDLYDVGAWGSLVAGIFTYLGSSFLGVVVFYNTQSQQREQDIEDQIVVDIGFYLKNDDINPKFFLPFSDEDINKNEFCYSFKHCKKSTKECEPDNMSYLYYQVINRNTHIPVYIEPVSIYVFNGKEYIDAGYKICYTDMIDSDAIDYKQKMRFYLGTDKRILKKDYYLTEECQLCCVAIKITSIKGQVLYASSEYLMGNNLVINGPVFYTEEEYKEKIKKMVHRFLLKQICIM